MNNETRNAMIAEWMDMKAKLTHVKEREMEMRKALAHEFGITHCPEGKSHFSTDIYRVEMTRKFTYRLLEGELEEMGGEFTEEEEACIVTKRSLSLSKYRALLDTSVIDDCIETKDATPTIAVTYIEVD